MKSQADAALREAIACEAQERVDLRGLVGLGGPLFLATYPTNFPVSVADWEPDVGDGVVLHSSDGQAILARIVQASDRTYVAEIQNVRESVPEHQGRRAGGRVRFTYGQIFICWRRAGHG